MLTLIGSSMHQSSAMSSKPCHLSPGRSTHGSWLSVSSSGGASSKAIFFPPGPLTVSTFHGLKNQSFFFANSRRTRPTAWRKSTASLITSCVSERPPLPSIIDVVMSFDATIAYSGEVLVCIMYA